MSKTILIAWNVILTLAVGILFWNMNYEEQSSYDIAQDTVLCGYITDLQYNTGVDRTTMPDCEGDVEKIFGLISK